MAKKRPPFKRPRRYRSSKREKDAFKQRTGDFLNAQDNPKTGLGEVKGYKTAIMYLAPANTAGFGNVCAAASPGCEAACLFSSGKGGLTRVQQARIRRNEIFFRAQAQFWLQLEWEIENFLHQCDRFDWIPCIRLNGTSDLPWERMSFRSNTPGMEGRFFRNVFARFPDVTFYDYTKRFERTRPSYREAHIPENYHLTFSLSEQNLREAQQVIREGLYNVAAVFRNTAKLKVDRKFVLPETWMGLPVKDGTEDDLRFLDPQGVIVGLSEKSVRDRNGKVKPLDARGFVQVIELTEGEIARALTRRKKNPEFEIPWPLPIWTHPTNICDNAWDSYPQVQEAVSFDPGAVEVRIGV